jgi:hypothetical protein
MQGYKGTGRGTKIIILMVIIATPLLILFGLFATYCC